MTETTHVEPAPSATEGASLLPPPAARPRQRSRVARAAEATADFLRRVYESAGEDRIFFMASAVAFSMIVAFVPFLLAVVGIAAMILRGQHPDPAQPLVAWILSNVPPVSAGFESDLRDQVNKLLSASPRLASIGTLLFVWFATRFVGTARTVLREVFDIQHDLGIIRGKLFDIKIVLFAGTLFALNIALTIVVEVVARLGEDLTGLRPTLLPFAAQLYGRMIAFVTVWIMFLLVYRYLPDRKIRWRTALVAASFTSVLFELMKQGFAWYATDVAHYGSTYAGLTTLAILVFWIYYTAVAFILGAEVAQVATMQWIRRRQKQRLR